MNITTYGIPLPIDNIDTDQIIPALYLKQTDKKGFGKHLFHNWRYNEKGEINPDFILNHPIYCEASILVVGHNFGCGSSREHAAWALSEYGIRVVISSGFADIFKGNAYNNNIIPVELPAEDLQYVFSLLEKDPTCKINIDLGSQQVSISDHKFLKHFDIDPFKKQCLLTGRDDTDFLVNLREEIIEFEKNR